MALRIGAAGEGVALVVFEKAVYDYLVNVADLGVLHVALETEEELLELVVMLQVR